MAKKVIRLTESQLTNIVNQSIEKILHKDSSGMLLEMAFPRKTYKEKVDNEIPQVLTNWCLTHYCTLSNRENIKKHWKGELRGHMIGISRHSITRNDSIHARQKVFDEIWDENDYSSQQFLTLTVCNKFIEENINIDSDAFKNTIMDCINDSNSIVNCILERDINKIQEYIETI